MDETPLVADGTDSTVEIAGRKLILRHRGVKTLLQRGLKIYRNPRSLAGAFDGPSKKVVTAALAENKDLVKLIVGTVKETGTGSTSTDDDVSPARALGEALQHNRRAVIDALRENDALVKSWLRDHKDLAGIVLKGDVHVFLEDVTSAALATGRDGQRLLILTVDGDRLTVPYDAAQEADFRRLCAALAGSAPPPAAELPSEAPVPAPTSTAPPTAAPATKTCPMCAESVKAAAVLCRFCGHRFDEQ